jgi:tetratricopeptide (TPR) repeat protein
MKHFAVVVIALVVGACSSEGARHKAAGNVFFKANDIDGAVHEYRAAVAAQPNDANAHTLLGNALFEKSAWDESRAEYQKALELDGSARAALQGLASLELRQGHPKEARALYERMVAAQPSDGEAHAALGKLLYAEGDLDGAERHLREALVRAQNDRAALYTLGLVLAKRKDLEQANAIFDRLEALAPDRAYAPYGRALAAAEAGRDDEAFKQLAVALDRGVDDVASVERDPGFARLKGDKRFVDLVAAARGRAPPRKGSPGP